MNCSRHTKSTSVHALMKSIHCFVLYWEFDPVGTYCSKLSVYLGHHFNRVHVCSYGESGSCSKCSLYIIHERNVIDSCVGCDDML